MAETVSILVGHPWLVGFLTISLLVFAGQTYDFILKLVGRSSVQPKPADTDGGWGGTDGDGPLFPPEPSDVPIPGQPDGVVGENGIPGDQPQEYVFCGDDPNGGHWAGKWGSGAGNKGDRPYITSEDGNDDNNNGKDE